MSEEKPDKEHKPDERSEEYDNFQKLLEKVLSTPKEEVDKRREEYEREKERKRAG